MNTMTKDEVRERLGNIDQIRDIIFGAQSREYDARLDQLKADMDKHQQDLNTRLDHLKTNLTTEIKSATNALSKKLRTFDSNHKDEAADLRQQLERLNRKFTNSIDDLDESLEERSKAIQSELVDTRDRYQGEILALRDMIMRELEERAKELQSGKVSRLDMAEVLMEMGMRLQGSELIPTLNEMAEPGTDIAKPPAARKPNKPTAKAGK